MVELQAVGEAMILDGAVVVSLDLGPLGVVF
jgi:hypothetical protein